ncbi:MAG: hypothetical protein QXG91_00125 [Candidatus Aenigmatarchaeota archaeon]
MTTEYQVDIKKCREDGLKISRKIPELWKIIEPSYKNLPKKIRGEFKTFLFSLYFEAAKAYHSTICGEVLDIGENVRECLFNYLHLNNPAIINSSPETFAIIYDLIYEKNIEKVIKSKILDIYEEMMGIKVRKSLDEIIDNSKIKNILEKYGIERNDAFYTMLYSTFVGMHLYDIAQFTYTELINFSTKSFVVDSIVYSKSIHETNENTEEKFVKIANDKDFIEEIENKYENVLKNLLFKVFDVDEDSQKILLKIHEVKKQKPSYIL